MRDSSEVFSVVNNKFLKLKVCRCFRKTALQTSTIIFRLPQLLAGEQLQILPAAVVRDISGQGFSPSQSL